METLTNYSFWQLVAIVVAIFACAKAIYDFFVWILDKFNIYHSQKSKQEKLEEQLKENTDKIDTTNKRLDDAVVGMTKYFEIQKITIRHSIIRSCEEYLGRGWIYSYELESTLDLYEVYKELGGNSYCSAMVDKIKNLTIKQEGN